MMRGFRDLTGAEVAQGYGATEPTPLVARNLVEPSIRARLTDDELFEQKRNQGYVIPGVDVRLVDVEGREAPWDGVAQGEVWLRGPWITTSYHGRSEQDSADRFEDGWWRSGDVGTIDTDGYLKLTDRLKDVIKSGGEWISSIDMENLLVSHPKIVEAAVVGIQHPQWQEQPFVLIVPKPGQEVTLKEVQAHLSSAFAKWQLPEMLEVVIELPKTSVGKLNKKAIRANYADVYGGAHAHE